MQKPAAAKSPPRRTGFERQMLALFAENTTRALRGEPHGPTSVEELRDEVARHTGHRPSRASVTNWRTGAKQARGEHVTALERIFGAPWLAIDNPDRQILTRDERLAFWTTWAVEDREMPRAARAIPRARARSRRR